MPVELKPMIDMPRPIEIDRLFPLIEPFELNIQGKKFVIPFENTYGLFRNYEGVVAAKLDEDLSKIGNAKEPVEIARLNLVVVDEKQYRQGGFIRIIGLPDKTSALTGIIQGKSSKMDFHDGLNIPYKYSILTGRLANNIGSYRYGIETSKIVHDGYYEENPNLNKLLKASSKPRKIINGYVKHDKVKRLIADVESLNSPNELVLKYMNKEFLVKPRYERLSCHNMPVVGIFTHPFDDDKLILLRLQEQSKTLAQRNRFIITEMGQNEIDIGHIYFRILHDKILADGVYVGEGLTRTISEEEAQKYRCAGLGSRILETTEEVFKARYNRNLVEIEGQMYFNKDEALRNPWDFFMSNGYRIISGGSYDEKMNTSIGAIFEKQI